MKCAIEEDADILGISCLSGAHLKLAEEILKARSKVGITDLRIVMGGVIADNDVLTLSEMGIDLVIPTGKATIGEVVGAVGSLVRNHTPLAV
jgi:methylmalonyl-CoA mutase C-terminal domain/subunit